MLLREKDKQTLNAIFSKTEIPVEVWAYGSQVNGTAHDGRDLDLVIRTATLSPLPYPIIYLLREQISNCNVPILVELWDWTRLPPSFQQNILQQYEVLFDNRKTFASIE